MNEISVLGSMDDKDEPIQDHHILPRHTWAVEHNPDCLSCSHYPKAKTKIDGKMVKCICRPLDLETDNYVHPLNNDSGDKWTVPLPLLTHYDDTRNIESLTRLVHAIKHWERFQDLNEAGDAGGAVLLARGEIDGVNNRGENNPNYTEGRFCLDNPDRVENNATDMRERYRNNQEYREHELKRKKARYDNDDEYKEGVLVRQREEYKEKYGIDEEYTEACKSKGRRFYNKNKIRLCAEKREKYAQKKIENGGSYKPQPRIKKYKSNKSNEPSLGKLPI